MSSIGEFEASLLLSGTLAKPRTQLQTNLGKQLAEGFGTALTSVLESRRREVALQLESEIRNREDLLRRQLGDRYGDLTAQLKLQETSARAMIDKVAGGRTLDLGKTLRVLR